MAAHQRMDRPAKLQIAAEADGQVVEMALFLVDGDEVRQGLGGVVVAAVTGVDHRHHESACEATRGAPSLGWRMAMISQ